MNSNDFSVVFISIPFSIETVLLRRMSWRNLTCILYFGDVKFCLCLILDNSKYFLHFIGL